MNNKPVIAFTLLSALVATTCDAEDAHADLASERVHLRDGSAFGCTGTGSRGFYRVVEDPDGGHTYSVSTEFRVPAGYYLEINSIAYEIPFYMKWATGYVNTMSITIKNRSSGASTPVFHTKFSNRQSYAADGSTWDATNEWLTPGAQTLVASFPNGPLMGNAARLCANAPSSFWSNLGYWSIDVRGRLVPTGEPTVQPIDPINQL